jgi:hypothetical protein
MLGSVAGNLALTLGARGGVYVGGGIVPRLGAWFDTSPFRERFENKGRFTALLQGIPVQVITSAQSPALLGAARALDAARLKLCHRHRDGTEGFCGCNFSLINENYRHPAARCRSGWNPCCHTLACGVPSLLETR